MTTHMPARLRRGLAALGLLPLLAPCLTLVACNNDPQSGSLTINYRFEPAGGVSCNEHAENVVDVRVEVGGLGDDAIASESVTCDNAGGEIVLAGVAAGSYDLFALGIDDEGDAVLDNLGDEDEDDERVEIIGGDTKTLEVALGLAPARLEVGLVVTNNAFPAQCASDEITIKGVRAQAWDNVNSELLKSYDFDLCDFAGYLPVPDEDREIKGRRFDGVVIQAIDAAGDPVGTSTRLDFDGPVGAGKLVQVSVECENQDETCVVEVLGGAAGTTTEDPTGGEATAGDATTGDATTGGSGTTAGGDTTG